MTKLIVPTMRSNVVAGRPVFLRDSKAPLLRSESILRLPVSFCQPWVLVKVESCGAQQGGFATMVTRSASTWRVTGWAFSVSPCPDRLLSRRPTGPRAPQCASLALVVVSGANARILSSPHPNHLYLLPSKHAAGVRDGVSHTRPARSPTADHLLKCSKSFWT